MRREEFRRAVIVMPTTGSPFTRILFCDEDENVNSIIIAPQKKRQRKGRVCKFLNPQIFEFTENIFSITSKKL